MSKIAGFIFLLIGIAIAAQDSSNRVIRLTEATDSQSGKTVWEVTRDELLAAPKWSPLSDVPPISVPEAIQIAKNWANIKYTNRRVISVELISLCPISGTSFHDCWFYVIGLKISDNSEPPKESTIEVVIMLDKTVVEPKEKR